jgi:hypothetical protein
MVSSVENAVYSGYWICMQYFVRNIIPDPRSLRMLFTASAILNTMDIICSPCVDVLAGGGHHTVVAITAESNVAIVEMFTISSWLANILVGWFLYT